LLEFNSKHKSENDPYAIEVDNVSKRFRIPHEKKTTVYENLVGKITGKSYNYEIFEALKEISFKVKKGETLGIIGQNGSGKSTLLKIIAGVLSPDSGSIKVKDKVAPFLELGVGFQPELTAIENVYLYGSIMGITHAEMDSKLDSIFEFAELDKFRDTKLKNFSSGMYARLAFATAISTDPDILLIDEALSVGDESFQQKCGERIKSIRQKGKTIVFVSHDLNTVKHLCNRCLLINHGVISDIGDTEQVIEKYHKMISKNDISNENDLITINNETEDFNNIDTLSTNDLIPSSANIDSLSSDDLIPSSDHTDTLSSDDLISSSTDAEILSSDALISSSSQIDNFVFGTLAKARFQAYEFPSNVHIGDFTYGEPQIYMWTDKYHIYIGKYTFIDTNVKIIVDGNHNINWISSYPFGELIHGIPKNPGHPIGKDDIIIGNDVWFGYSAIIMPGVKIGDGAVIGAGSIVTKNVDDYEVVAGNPAKHIRYRFSKEKIDKLKKIKWWDWPIEKIKENVDLLQSNNINNFILHFGSEF
jgi:ABC-type polysaccharide/polyol phosphate transport system ATPase subunit/acetyltransferase-like isoleucine patch superfamily enzyme